MNSAKHILALLAITTLVVLARTGAAATFGNGATLVINDGMPPTVASNYPSTINVSDLSGTITKVTVTFTNLSHFQTGDLDVLLVGPTGARLVCLSDVGGVGTTVNATITLDDSAALFLPTSTSSLTSGTYLPTDSGVASLDVFPAPAPLPLVADHAAPASTATFASQFNGSNPNGTWSLYVVDDNISAGQIAANSYIQGWSLMITTAAVPATTTTVSSSANPAFTGSNVTFTATVVNATNAAPVTSGSVTFMEGATTLAPAVAVNASGQAGFSTSALVEGSHVITANYTSGGGLFAGSSGSLTQVFNHRSTTNGTTFCNPGSILIPDNGPANVYPSLIYVSGLTGTVAKVTLTLSNLAHFQTGDLDLLLVSPTGAKLVVLSDVGGTATTPGVTLTLDDDAATPLPTSSTALRPGTFRPTAAGAVADVFKAPAHEPSFPADHAAPSGAATFASQFNGINPNGTWSLYVVDDLLSAGQNTENSRIADGWSLNFTLSTAPPSVTSLGSSLNPALVGNSLVFTATVQTNGGSVPWGTVTFKDGTNALATNAVSLGQATYTNATLSEGSHLITAVFNGTATAATSSVSLTQAVDNATVVSGNRFGNGGAITLSSVGGAGTPYPSHIFIAGVASTISTITLTLSNCSHAFPNSVDILLVGPAGQQLVVMSDVGGSSAVGPVTLTLDDAAATTMASGFLLGGDFRPTDINSGAADSFPGVVGPYPSAAPAGTHTFTSAFGGINPNGLWSLYAFSDGLGATGSIAAGWSLTIQTPPSIICSSNLVATTAFNQTHSAPLAFTVTGGGLPAPTVSCRLGTNVITSPFTFPIGTNIVTCTASNGIGAPAVCSFTVTVRDAQPPVITCSTNILTTIAANGTGANVSFIVTATDNFGMPTVVCNPASGAFFPPGNNLVTCTATDAAGNVANCSFTVTVNRRPVAADDVIFTRQNNSVSVTTTSLLANDTDADGDSLVLTDVSPISVNGGQVTLTGSQVTYTPKDSFTGTDRFTYTIGDGRGGTAQGTVVATVASEADLAAIIISISNAPTGSFLHALGFPGQPYVFQATGPITGPWTNLSGTLTPGTNRVLDFLDTFQPRPPSRFYRAKTVP